jgi:outer membrane protein TolC
MRSLRWCVAMFALAMSAGIVLAQSNPPSESGAAQAPIILTFPDAVARARKNLPQFLSARTDVGLAHQDKVQARAALLPTLSYNSEFIYTQGNGSPSGVFIANNTVHEYVSQGNAHESMNLAGGQVFDLRRSQAAEAAAKAKLEIASRGLVVTVSQNFYGVAVAQRKYATAQTAMAEAERFLKLSRDLEQGGEVAHSDAIKAELQFNDRQRGLQEAKQTMENARLALAVILFQNLDQNFIVADDLELAGPLPTFQEARTLAGKNNPEIGAAIATVAAADDEVRVARSGHFPNLSFDYWYGIDADHFAIHDPSGVRNLGYAAAASLQIPIWSWGATQSKVKQAELERDRTKVELSFTQRQAAANLLSFYREAEMSRSQLDLLRKSFELASESSRLTTLRYQAGEATVLEVVDAQNTLTQTHDAYDDAQLRYRVAAAELQTLTGPF